ncbi:condensation domain-containing protein [Serratia ureilytica]|uniref:condensation domain-containing protein n=1 Tax=Serratia ureilytica TaxID=300181 RepID=UPI0038661E79
MQGEMLEQQLAYWSTTLSGYENLALPTDRLRPVTPDYRGKDRLLFLDAELSARLRAFAAERETTLYTVLLSAFYVTLAMISGQDDIVIGTPSDNRHHAQTQELIGLFVNSLALRARVQPQMSITKLIAQVHQVVASAKMHQDLPFEQVLNALNVSRAPSIHPIFQVMFSLQRFGQADAWQNLPLIPVEYVDGQLLYSPAKFDLTLFIDDGLTCITGCLNFAESLFDDQTR